MTFEVTRKGSRSVFVGTVIDLGDGRVQLQSRLFTDTRFEGKARRDRRGRLLAIASKQLTVRRVFDAHY